MADRSDKRIVNKAQEGKVWYGMVRAGRMIRRCREYRDRQTDRQTVAVVEVAEVEVAVE
jgi:hypothetical protein